jgi:hypothetical protein
MTEIHLMRRAVRMLIGCTYLPEQGYGYFDFVALGRHFGPVSLHTNRCEYSTLLESDTFKRVALA